MKHDICASCLVSVAKWCAVGRNSTAAVAVNGAVVDDVGGGEQQDGWQNIHNNKVLKIV